MLAPFVQEKNHDNAPLRTTGSSTKFRHMITKNRKHLTSRSRAAGRALREAEAAAAEAERRKAEQARRFRKLYEEWRTAEQATGGRATVVTFAAVLFPEGAHSSIAEQLNGKRELTVRVLQRCRELWEISPTWLLCGDGPKFVFETVAPGTLEEMLAERIRNAIAAASSPELPLDHGVSDYESQGLRVGVAVGRGERFRVNGAAAVEFVAKAAVEEAIAIHRWRDHVNALNAIVMARSTGAPLPIPPVEILSAPAVRRATRHQPPIPTTAIVTGT